MPQTLRGLLDDYVADGRRLRGISGRDLSKTLIQPGPPHTVGGKYRRGASLEWDRASGKQVYSEKYLVGKTVQPGTWQSQAE